MGKHGRPTPLVLHRKAMRGPRGRRVTQKLIAALAGIPNCQGLVSKTERGHMPEPELAKALAKAYRLRLDEFKRLVEGAQCWELPLWKFAEVDGPAQIEDLPAPGKTTEVRQA